MAGRAFEHGLRLVPHRHHVLARERGPSHAHVRIEIVRVPRNPLSELGLPGVRRRGRAAAAGPRARWTARPGRHRSRSLPLPGAGPAYREGRAIGPRRPRSGCPTGIRASRPDQGREGRRPTVGGRSGEARSRLVARLPLFRRGRAASARLRAPARTSRAPAARPSAWWRCRRARAAGRRGPRSCPRGRAGTGRERWPPECSRGSAGTAQDLPDDDGAEDEAGREDEEGRRPIDAGGTVHRARPSGALPPGQPYARSRTSRTAAARRWSSGQGVASGERAVDRRRFRRGAGPPQGGSHDRTPCEQAEEGPQPDEPVHAAQGGTQPHELTVGPLEVGEHLLLVVARRQQRTHLGLHVRGHGRGRVGHGQALADRAAQQPAHFLGSRVEGGAAERHALRCADDERRVGGRGARPGLGRLGGGRRRQQEDEPGASPHLPRTLAPRAA